MRDFTAKALNANWCGDVTYIVVGSAWLSVAGTASAAAGRCPCPPVDRRDSTQPVSNPASMAFSDTFMRSPTS